MIDFLSRSYTEANSGCWLWAGSCCEKGYGRVNISGKNKRAHRVSWSQENGPIPDGAFVCHRCDTPSCVNPDHLWIGSPLENMEDMISKGRDKPNRGTKNGFAVLNESVISDVRNNGLSCRETAEFYGVHVTTIRRVRSKTHWSHVL